MSSPRLLAAVVLGGAVGGLLRWSAGELMADGAGFPQTTFAINVVGSFVLALLPGVPAVRRRPAWGVALGPGLLGGFTTLSAASAQTRALLDDGDPTRAAVYLAGTLLACLVAVTVGSRLGARSPREVES